MRPIATDQVVRYVCRLASHGSSQPDILESMKPRSVERELGRVSRLHADLTVIASGITAPYSRVMKIKPELAVMGQLSESAQKTRDKENFGRLVDFVEVRVGLALVARLAQDPALMYFDHNFGELNRVMAFETFPQLDPYEYAYGCIIREHPEILSKHKGKNITIHLPTGDYRITEPHDSRGRIGFCRACQSKYGGSIETMYSQRIGT